MVSRRDPTGAHGRKKTRDENGEERANDYKNYTYRVRMKRDVVQRIDFGGDADKPKIVAQGACRESEKRSGDDSDDAEQRSFDKENRDQTS